MKHATIGRVLLYTLCAGDGCHPHAVGEQRPATVVRVFGGARKLYNVQVLTDGANDFPNELHGGSGLFWKTSVSMADAPEEGSLNWPVLEDAKKFELKVAPELEPAEDAAQPPASEDAPPSEAPAPAEEAPKKQAKRGKKPARA